MIILPDKNIPRAKFLIPLQDKEWKTPSQRASLYSDENQTRFRLTAKTHDGVIMWRGWFDDRADADAFLYALATGTLHIERELWRMPTPAWHPGIAEELSYEFATTVFLTTTGSNTYSVPSDWNSANNTVETVGAGAGGGGGSGSNGGGGGAGGGYSKATNVSLTGGGSASYTVGVKGTGGSVSGNGTAGGDTFLMAHH